MTGRTFEHKRPPKKPHPIKPYWDKQYRCSECHMPLKAIYEKEAS